MCVCVLQIEVSSKVELLSMTMRQLQSQLDTLAVQLEVSVTTLYHVFPFKVRLLFIPYSMESWWFSALIFKNRNTPFFCLFNLHREAESFDVLVVCASQVMTRHSFSVWTGLCLCG